MLLGLGVPRRGLFFCQATGSSPSVGWLRERRMNPKCLGGAVPDTFSAKSVDSTGLFSMPITRAASSFDHLAGSGEQCRRHFEAERLRRAQIDHELELDRL